MKLTQKSEGLCYDGRRFVIGGGPPPASARVWQLWRVGMPTLGIVTIVGRGGGWTCFSLGVAKASAPWSVGTGAYDEGTKSKKDLAPTLLALVDSKIYVVRSCNRG